MTKTVPKYVAAVRQMRKQLATLRQETEDLTDRLLILEARAQNEGKRTYTLDEVKKRYGIK